MKKDINQIILIFFAFTLTSCISPRPPITSVHDGIRCSQPTNAISAEKRNTNRTPATTQMGQKEQICEQLFVK